MLRRCTFSAWDGLARPGLGFRDWHGWDTDYAGCIQIDIVDLWVCGCSVLAWTPA
jgi:hypothetical protein